MAKAVEFREFTPSNSRDDLIRRVEKAPAEHAEALLAAWDLLERLHEKGVLDLLSGLLSAGDMVVDRVTDIISSEQMVTKFRMALVFTNLLGAMDFGKLHAVIAENAEEPASLLAILKEARSKDVRRAMSVAVGMMSVWGAALNAQQEKI
jgi:uncharacterized protein YjgD (DUF1641 family)